MFATSKARLEPNPEECLQHSQRHRRYMIDDLALYSNERQKADKQIGLESENEDVILKGFPCRANAKVVYFEDPRPIAVAAHRHTESRIEDTLRQSGTRDASTPPESRCSGALLVVHAKDIGCVPTSRWSIAVLLGINQQGVIIKVNWCTRAAIEKHECIFKSPKTGTHISNNRLVSTKIDLQFDEWRRCLSCVTFLLPFLFSSLLQSFCKGVDDAYVNHIDKMVALFLTATERTFPRFKKICQPWRPIFL
jgi:hypothetical protein